MLSEKLLMFPHEVYGTAIVIIKLIDVVDAYIVPTEEGNYELYIHYDKELDLMDTFESLQDAITFAEDLWATNEPVLDFIEMFNKAKNKRATRKQIDATDGTCATHSECIIFFAKRTAYFTLKDILGKREFEVLRKKVNESRRRGRR